MYLGVPYMLTRHTTSGEDKKYQQAFLVPLSRTLAARAPPPTPLVMACDPPALDPLGRRHRRSQRCRCGWSRRQWRAAARGEGGGRVRAREEGRTAACTGEVIR
jgi:hypothetical protein